MSRVVVKLGGRVARRAAAERCALHEAGHEVVVVHGAGPQISAELERRGIALEFVGGRRVTSAAVLEVVRESFVAVNAEVCAAIGPDAVGLIGDEIGLEAEPVPALGLVGDPLPVVPDAVLEGARRRLHPGRRAAREPSELGPLNVNADEAAAALAVGLGADRILFVTDVPGVLVDGDLVAALPVDDADRMLGAGAFEGGIVPEAERRRARGPPRRPRPRSARRRCSDERPSRYGRHGRAGALLPTYARADVTIVRGEGCRVWDDAGREYLDFVAGIAVVGLGHCHPAPLAAAQAQLERLWHASNLYFTEPMARLARAPLRAARRCAGLLLQLRRRGERGRDQVRAQGDRPSAASSRSTAASTAARSARCRRRGSRRSGRGSGRSSPVCASRGRTTSSRSRRRSRRAATSR